MIRRGLLGMLAGVLAGRNCPKPVQAALPQKFLTNAQLLALPEFITLCKALEIKNELPTLEMSIRFAEGECVRTEHVYALSPDNPVPVEPENRKPTFGSPTDGYSVYHWPEFKAFCTAVGFARYAPTVDTEIIIGPDPDGLAKVRHVYHGREAKDRPMLMNTTTMHNKVCGTYQPVANSGG